MPVVAQAVLAAKREAILASAVLVFAERGFAESEMDSIAAAAGVAKGTLYRYFKNKEELFLAAVDRSFERLTEFVIESIICLDDPVAIVRTSFRAIARFCQKSPDVMALLAEERSVFRDRPPRVLLHRNKNRPYFAEIVRRGIEQGVFRDVDPNAVVQTLVYLMQGLILGSRQEGASEELVPRAEQAVDLLLGGLLREKRT
jgi:AcrR family transcriptional regulator